MVAVSLSARWHVRFWTMKGLLLGSLLLVPLVTREKSSTVRPAFFDQQESAAPEFDTETDEGMLKLSEPDESPRPAEPNRPDALPLPKQDRDKIERQIKRRRMQQLSMLDILGLTALIAFTPAVAQYRDRPELDVSHGRVYGPEQPPCQYSL